MINYNWKKHRNMTGKHKLNITWSITLIVTHKLNASCNVWGCRNGHPTTRPRHHYSSLFRGTLFARRLHAPRRGSLIICCLAPRARNARASQMTIPPLTGGSQPRKSGWSIVEISISGHTHNFAHNENTFCSMPYHNLVEINPRVLM